MIALYQNNTIRQVENTVYQRNMATEWELMQRAGHAAFLKLLEIWPNISHVAVLCGSGNNAGDGFVVAHYAYLQGLSVSIYTMADQSAYEGVARTALNLCLSAGVSVFPYDPECFISGDLIVDALLGTGLSGEIREPYCSVIKAINQLEIPVLSLDLPSGVHSDSGDIQGCAVKADATITFIALKQGLYTGAAVSYVGDIYLDDLSVPPELFPELLPSASLINPTALLTLLPPRTRDSNKGDFGHVLVIGGDYGMAGAVCMAATAALRVGAGLVSVVTRAEHVAIITGMRPEVMCHGLSNADQVAPLLKKASVIIIGPGLGQADWGKELLQVVLESKKPMVVDADALHLLSDLEIKKENWVLTPHPGEASYLLNTTISQVQSDRFSTAQKIIQAYGGTCVLKGAGTVIASDQVSPSVCDAGNPGMATAGMGDVLSGVIGGLIAQGLIGDDAAKQGVLLHAMAADLAVRVNGERGLLAYDLMPHLRRLVNNG